MIQRLKHYFIAYLGKWIIHLIYKTCRVEFTGLENLTSLSPHEKCILALWHNRLAMAAEILAPLKQFRYVAVISNSRDGEPLAIFTESYSHASTIRVPHNDRHGALLKIINHLRAKQGIVVVTPDGPRGPRYQVKPGMIWAAKETSAKIIPLTWTPNKFWQIKSWDKMLFPKPFSKIQVAIGKPIFIPEEEENGQSIVQSELLTLTQKTCETLFTDSNHWPL